MLTLRAVSLVSEGNRLLSDVDLTIRQAERLVILGPNGAGKTLLMQVAHRLLLPTRGEVVADAGPLREAMVFQHPVLLRRSVLANVLYAIDHARLPPAATAGKPAAAAGKPAVAAGKPADPDAEPHSRLAQAETALRLVGLEALARRPARVLSGGEQQRVALARAAALRPDLIWFDEPTANLDPASTRAIEAIVMTMGEAGTTCVMSTHDIGQARRLAQRVLLMAAGRIIELSPAEQFFDQPATNAGQRFLRGELING